MWSTFDKVAFSLRAIAAGRKGCWLRLEDLPRMCRPIQLQLKYCFVRQTKSEAASIGRKSCWRTRSQWWYSKWGRANACALAANIVPRKSSGGPTRLKKKLWNTYKPPVHRFKNCLPIAGHCYKLRFAWAVFKRKEIPYYYYKQFLGFVINICSCLIKIYAAII